MKLAPLKYLLENHNVKVIDGIIKTQEKHTIKLSRYNELFIIINVKFKTYSYKLDVVKDETLDALIPYLKKKGYSLDYVIDE